MKKVMITALLLCAIVVTAQEKGKSEVRLAYSDASYILLTESFANSLSNTIVSGITGVKYKDAKSTVFGMYEMGYRYNIGERLKIGGDISYMRTEDKFEKSSTNPKTVKRISNYFMGMVMGQYSYIKTSRLDFYGSGGVGFIGLSTKDQVGGSYKDNTLGFAFQINPVGLRVGKAFGAFIEVGYGYKGIATGGFNYRFK
ncbi:outer membrane beta-barrel protein [Flavobacterium sp.]|uniref:outer membrane beta-barrel protein n=1 Tax=Flavobacterium sp. TaxID=239 RepID=UPI0025BA90D7|nr:outer membrane beta-barrel protein [Flavobacterium sp.]